MFSAFLACSRALCLGKIVLLPAKCPPPPPPPPLRTSSRAPAAIESHYSIRVQLPRRQHSHTRGINDLVTYKFQ